jgi:hypothetical protein
MYLLFFHLHLLTIRGPQTALKGLGAAPIKGCKFVTSSLLTDARSLGVSARVMEQLGVSGYLGTAHLIQDQNVLTVVSSIMTTQRAKATPATFNLPMSVAEVVRYSSQVAISGQNSVLRVRFPNT